MISIERLRGKPVAEQGVEIVERKGKGHRHYIYDVVPRIYERIRRGDIPFVSLSDEHQHVKRPMSRRHGDRV